MIFSQHYSTYYSFIYKYRGIGLWVFWYDVAGIGFGNCLADAVVWGAGKYLLVLLTCSRLLTYLDFINIMQND